MSEDVSKRLTKLFPRLFDAPEPTINGYRGILKSEGIDPLNILVIPLNGSTAVESLVVQNETLKKEMRSLKRAGGHAWADFERAAATKIDLNARMWMRDIANMLAISLGDLKECKKLDRVPNSYMLRLGELPDLQPLMTLNDEFREFLKDCHYKLNLPMQTISRLLSGCVGHRISIGQIERAVQISVSVKDGEVLAPEDPTGFSRQELENMGFNLFGTSSKKKLRNFCEAHLQFDVEVVRKKEMLTPQQTRQVRELYHAEIALRKECPAYSIMSKNYALVKRAQKYKGDPTTPAMAHDEFAKIAQEWFQTTHTPLLVRCMSMFSGYSTDSIKHMLIERDRPISKPMVEFVLAVEQERIELANRPS